MVHLTKASTDHIDRAFCRLLLRQEQEQNHSWNRMRIVHLFTNHKKEQCDFHVKKEGKQLCKFIDRILQDEMLCEQEEKQQQKADANRATATAPNENLETANSNSSSCCG